MVVEAEPILRDVRLVGARESEAAEAGVPAAVEEALLWGPLRVLGLGQGRPEWASRPGQRGLGRASRLPWGLLLSRVSREGRPARLQVGAEFLGAFPWTRCGWQPSRSQCPPLGLPVLSDRWALQTRLCRRLSAKTPSQTRRARFLAVAWIDIGQSSS